MIKSQHHQYVSLPVRPPSRALDFPTITKPQALGFFSINTRREFERNDCQLRYYKEPMSLPCDLNIGLSMAIKKPDNSINEPLDNLLKFLYDHHKRILVRKPPEFVSWRGLLRRIMCTPYEYRQDWCIHVTRFNNTIYMLKRETAQEEMQRLHTTEQQNKPCSWGFKFEQYCLSETPFKDPDTTRPVNECEEFSIVFNTCLVGMSLLYGAEMDGVASTELLKLNYDEPVLNDIPFIELKVRQDKLNEKQHNTYLRHKTRDWWCQSFLVGIRDMYVGMRTNEGLVQRIKRVDVASLSKNGAEKYWAPWACTNFLQQFLSMVKTKTVNENCPYTVYEFYFEAHSGRISYRRVEGKTDKSFIPDWYIDLIRRIQKQQNSQN